MNYIISTLLVTILLFGGCRSSGKTQDSADSNITEESKSLKVLAKEKLGEGVKMESSANWVLCTKEVEMRQLVFFVYDQNKSEIVYEDMNPVRSVSWESNNRLIVNPYDRIGNGENDAKAYYIDVATGERVQNSKRD
ncbi:MAG: hypothetical protein RIC80_19765 [Cyclobacteriaceae bacterium]